MGLLTDIEAEAHRKGPSCGVALTLASLPAEDRSDLLAAMTDPRYESNTISRVLAKRDIRIAGPTIARHRRGDCVCPRLAPAQ